MSVAATLLSYIECKEELYSALKNVHCHVEKTFKQCFDYVMCNRTGLDGSDWNLKINSVCDYIQDELHIGHWSEVSVDLRRAFTASSLIKTVVIIKTDSLKSENLKSALKCLDMGLLLGAPMEKNPGLLTTCASCLNESLARLEQNGTNVNTNKRKLEQSNEDFEDIRAEEIVALTCPSLDYFYQNHFAREHPVILQGCISHWPAIKKWMDVNYLLKIAGNRTVPVEIGSHYADENWSQKLMTLKEFITNHYLGRSDSLGYLAQHNLFDQIPELRCDIRIPEYCCFSNNKNNTDPDINAWFGPRGTVSPLHFDPKHNLLTQVFGKKQIILFSPEDSQSLYPHDDLLLFNTAQVDPLQPNLQLYPKFSEARMLKCLLKDEEILYIPPKWWHHVTALDNSFSVSFWWN